MRTKTEGNVILTSFDSVVVFASYFFISRFGLFAFDFLNNVFFPGFCNVYLHFKKPVFFCKALQT